MKHLKVVMSDQKETIAQQVVLVIFPVRLVLIEQLLVLLKKLIAKSVMPENIVHHLVEIVYQVIVKQDIIVLRVV